MKTSVLLGLFLLASLSLSRDVHLHLSLPGRDSLRSEGPSPDSIQKDPSYCQWTPALRRWWWTRTTPLLTRTTWLLNVKPMLTAMDRDLKSMDNVEMENVVFSCMVGLVYFYTEPNCDSWIEKWNIIFERIYWEFQFKWLEPEGPISFGLNSNLIEKHELLEPLHP